MGPHHKGMDARTVGVVVCILLAEMCERLTYYSVSGNLVLVCTSLLKLSSQAAVSVQLVFVGTSYLFPVLGGYVADSIAGRYNTILGSGLIYLLGMFLFPACSADYGTLFGQDEAGVGYEMSIEAKRGYFLSGLALVAIGTGGIKANVGPFGAQQVAKHGPEAVQSFFNWFYWFINMGGLIASTAVAYVQQSVSFTWGFVIPLCSMLVALVVFVAAKGNYVHTPPGGSVLITSIRVCRQGCSCCSKDPEDKYRPFLHSACVKNGGDFDDETVDGVRDLMKILPIFALILGYATVYVQMQSTFFLQSERLSVKVDGGEIPAAMLNVFNTIIIILLIPFVDRVVYPCLNRCGRPLPLLKRMGSVLITSIRVCRQGCSCCSKDPEDKYRPFLHSACVKNGGDFDDETVDGVRDLMKILPIFALILGYATVYVQMQSTFFLQSERLSVKVDGGEIPAAMLNVFNTIIIILLIPFVDRVVYPCLNRCGRPLPLLKRMVIGMLFAVLSMVVAGVVEIYRKQELTSSGGQTQVLGGQTFNSSHISVFVQIPQFALVGTSEVFTSIPCIEFAFTQSPPSMQGLLTGVYYAVMGLGNYVATLIIAIVNTGNNDPWLPDELNEGHGEYLFFLLGGLLLLNIGVFIFATRNFRYHSAIREVSVEVEGRKREWGEEEEKLGDGGEKLGDGEAGSHEEEALLNSDSHSGRVYTYGTTDTRL